MKDPALMFYTANFLNEVREMNFQQIGKYVKLICYQHADDKHIKPREFYNILSKQEDQVVIEMFEEDEDGCFFVRHVEEEIIRRKGVSKTKSENAKKKTK